MLLIKLKYEEKTAHDLAKQTISNRASEVDDLVAKLQQTNFVENWIKQVMTGESIQSCVRMMLMQIM